MNDSFKPNIFRSLPPEALLNWFSDIPTPIQPLPLLSTLVSRCGVPPYISHTPYGVTTLSWLRKPPTSPELIRHTLAHLTRFFAKDLKPVLALRPTPHHTTTNPLLLTLLLITDPQKLPKPKPSPSSSDDPTLPLVPEAPHATLTA